MCSAYFSFLLLILSIDLLVYEFWLLLVCLCALPIKSLVFVNGHCFFFYALYLLHRLYMCVAIASSCMHRTYCFICLCVVVLHLHLFIFFLNMQFVYWFISLWPLAILNFVYAPGICFVYTLFAISSFLYSLQILSFVYVHCYCFFLCAHCLLVLLSLIDYVYCRCFCGKPTKNLLLIFFF